MPTGSAGESQKSKAQCLAMFQSVFFVGWFCVLVNSFVCLLYFFLQPIGLGTKTAICCRASTRIGCQVVAIGGKAPPMSMPVKNLSQQRGGSLCTRHSRSSRKSMVSQLLSTSEPERRLLNFKGNLVMVRSPFGANISRSKMMRLGIFQSY